MKAIAARLFDDDQIDLDDLVEKLGAGDAEVRRVAVMDLGDSGENAALPHLFAALQDEKAVVLSFVLDGFRSEDVGAALDREGIAVRAGHHCAQPILRRFGLESTVRPSLALYNTFADIDALVAALHRIRSGSPLIG